MTTQPPEGQPDAAGRLDAALGHALFEIRKTFNLLVEPHRTDLWRFCLSLTGSVWDAEDLAQDTLLKAFGRLSTIFQPLDPKPYLFRIAANTWIDTMRRASPPLAEIDDELTASDAPADPDPIATHAAIARMVAVLPPRQRVVCLLADVFDISLPDVALMLNISTGAAKSLLHRARAALHAAPAAESAPLAAIGAPPGDALVRRYLDAFNRRDLDALLALLHPDAASDIAGVFIEYGRDTMKTGSLHAWATDARPQHAVYGTLAGRPVFFVMRATGDGEDALGWLITLDTADGCILRITDYYFCADLTRAAADALGVAALPNPPM